MNFMEQVFQACEALLLVFLSTPKIDMRSADEVELCLNRGARRHGESAEISTWDKRLISAPSDTSKQTTSRSSRGLGQLVIMKYYHLPLIACWIRGETACQLRGVQTNAESAVLRQPGC